MHRKNDHGLLLEAAARDARQSVFPEGERKGGPSMDEPRERMSTVTEEAIRLRVESWGWRRLPRAFMGMVEFK